MIISERTGIADDAAGSAKAMNNLERSITGSPVRAQQ